MGAYLGCKGLDVAVMVVVLVNKAHFGQPTHLKTPAVNVVKHAGGGRAAVLGVGRHDQHAGNALCLELV